MQGIRRLLTAAALLAAVSCGWLDSEPIRMETVRSPDGTVIADYYQNGGGGATGGVADIVALRRSDEPFRRRRDYVFGAVDARVVTIRWLGNRTLEITYPKGLDGATMKTSWHEVKIVYVAREYADR